MLNHKWESLRCNAACSKFITANTPVVNGCKRNDCHNGGGCSGSSQSYAVVSSSAFFFNLSHLSSDITKWGGTR